MGSVSRDIYRSSRENDVSYAYNEDGLASLLKDIYRIEERKWFKGDIDATTILVDLKLALDSDCLTPRMRQVIALYYFLQLTEEDVAKILEITQQMVNKAITSSIDRIANEIENGGARRRGRFIRIYETNNPLHLWLNDIAYNGSTIYEVPPNVIEDLLRIQGDALALEVLRQQKEGKLLYVEDYIGNEEYPCLTEEQFKWRDRRMSYVPDVKYDNKKMVGFRKTAILNNEDEWCYGRQRLFSK